MAKEVSLNVGLTPFHSVKPLVVSTEKSDRVELLLTMTPRGRARIRVPVDRYTGVPCGKATGYSLRPSPR